MVLIPQVSVKFEISPSSI